MFSETPVRGSEQTRPLPELRCGVSDSVSRCYGRQLERHHEGLVSTKSYINFHISHCIFLFGILYLSIFVLHCFFTHVCCVFNKIIVIVIVIVLLLFSNLFDCVSPLSNPERILNFWSSSGGPPLGSTSIGPTMAEKFGGQCTTAGEGSRCRSPSLCCFSLLTLLSPSPRLWLSTE